MEHHQSDAGRLGPGDDTVELIGKIREVEMAMVVDERHGARGSDPSQHNELMVPHSDPIPAFF